PDFCAVYGRLVIFMRIAADYEESVTGRIEGNTDLDIVERGVRDEALPGSRQEIQRPYSISPSFRRHDHAMARWVVEGVQAHAPVRNLAGGDDPRPCRSSAEGQRPSIARAITVSRERFVTAESQHAIVFDIVCRRMAR